MGVGKHPGALRQRGQRGVWHYYRYLDGRVWERSTGETDERLARRKVPELFALSELLRRQPGRSLRFSKALVRETARLEIDISPRQAQRVKDALKNFLKWSGDLPLEKITTGCLEEYQRHRLQIVAKSTVERELYYICRLLRREGFEVTKPKAKPGRETTNREFADDELKRFFKHCPPRHQCFFATLLETGARPAEMNPSTRSNHVALLKSEVNLERGFITIRPSKLLPGQKGITRQSPITPDLAELLKAEMSQVRGDFVFSPRVCLHLIFDRILIKAEIPKIDALKRKLTAHSFRHTWATKMAEHVQNSLILQHALGHKDHRSTARYVHAKAMSH